MTASEQWLERTLDDSANRRVVIPEAFLAVDGILEILINVLDGLVVYPKLIAAHVAAELPFMATENILMAAVKAGGNRQKLHEKIRQHSQAAAEQVKQFGKHNDLIDRLKADAAFSKVDFKAVLNPKSYVGRAPQQADEFLKSIATPIRRRYRKELNRKAELKV
jgi:adenylosuccinate lyase